MNYKAWSDSELERLRGAMAAGRQPHEIVAMFPDREPGAVRAKVYYEKHFGSVSEAAPYDEDYENTKRRDDRFQAKLANAIAMGLERLPEAAEPSPKFRPVYFVPEVMTFAKSPAAACAELGAPD